MGDAKRVEWRLVSGVGHARFHGVRRILCGVVVVVVVHLPHSRMGMACRAGITLSQAHRQMQLSLSVRPRARRLGPVQRDAGEAGAVMLVPRVCPVKQTAGSG